MPPPSMAGGISAAIAAPALFYTSEAVFPGQTDVQSATLDDPGRASASGADPDRRADRLDDGPGQAAPVRALPGRLTTRATALRRASSPDSNVLPRRMNLSRARLFNLQIHLWRNAQ